MRLTSSHPTFETKGDFQAIFLNRTNQDLYIATSHLDYSKLPPKEWLKGSDWTAEESKSVHPFNSPRDLNYLGWGIGGYPYLNVKDRSSAHVETGYTYIFYSDIGSSIRFCFKIIGVEGGSEVLPGFGLYDITEKPGEWTYIWPHDFQGQFGIQILSSVYVNPYSLSVEYKPLQNSQFTKPSAFIFTFEGATFINFTEEKPTIEKQKQAICQDILTSPKNYRITSSLE